MNIDRNPRTRTRLLMALPIVAIAFSLAACAGATRPTADDVASGFQKIIDDNDQGDLYTDDLVLCLAEAMVESDISDQDLSNIAQGIDVQTSTDAQAKLMEVVSTAAPDCATR